MSDAMSFGTEPKFKHDLRVSGWFMLHAFGHDVYICPSDVDPDVDVLVARYGDEDCEYASMRAMDLRHHLTPSRLGNNELIGRAFSDEGGQWLKAMTLALAVGNPCRSAKAF